MNGFFCRDSVESNAVKQSIDCFSNSVKEQLLEKVSLLSARLGRKREELYLNSKNERFFSGVAIFFQIASYKEFKVLKRENAKVTRTISFIAETTFWCIYSFIFLQHFSVIIIEF